MTSDFKKITNALYFIEKLFFSEEEEERERGDLQAIDNKCMKVGSVA